MTEGPSLQLPLGSYVADFYIRSPETKADFGSVVVEDLVSGNEVSESVSLLPFSNQWAVISISFSVTQTPNMMDYYFLWDGYVNLDFAFVRIR